jgi:hypothetical protein
VNQASHSPTEGRVELRELTNEKLSDAKIPAAPAPTIELSEASVKGALVVETSEGLFITESAAKVDKSTLSRGRTGLFTR